MNFYNECIEIYNFNLEIKNNKLLIGKNIEEYINKKYEENNKILYSLKNENIINYDKIKYYENIKVFLLYKLFSIQDPNHTYLFFGFTKSNDNNDDDDDNDDNDDDDNDNNYDNDNNDDDDNNNILY